jgi:hypothetical protein
MFNAETSQSTSNQYPLAPFPRAGYRKQVSFAKAGFIEKIPHFTKTVHCFYDPIHHEIDFSFGSKSANSESK